MATVLLTIQLIIKKLPKKRDYKMFNTKCMDINVHKIKIFMFIWA